MKELLDDVQGILLSYVYGIVSYLVEVYAGFWYWEDEGRVVSRCGLGVYLRDVGNGVTNLSYLS